MYASIRRLAVAALALVAVPLAAQQEVPMRGNTPVAPQGIKIPPLPDAPVRYETGGAEHSRERLRARLPESMEHGIRVGRHDPRRRTRRRHQGRAKRRGRSEAGARRAGGHRGGAVRHGPGAAPGLRTQPRRLYQLHQAARPAARRRAAGRPRGRTRWSWRCAATTLAVARAIWDGKGFTDTKDIFVGEGGSGGPIAFGGDGMLYVAHGRRRYAEAQDASAARSCGSRTRARCHRTIRSSAAPTQGPKCSRWATAHSCGWRSTRSPARSGRSRTGRTAATR